MFTGPAILSLTGHGIAAGADWFGKMVLSPDEYQFFHTLDALWLMCGAAALILTVPLAVGVFLLEPNRGFLVFWFLSVASLAMFAGAILSGAPLLGEGDNCYATFSRVIHVFAYFPVFLIPPATGAARYLSRL